MVSGVGIEPTRHGSSNHCSTGLSYPDVCPDCEPVNPVAFRGLPDQERTAGLFTDLLIPDRLSLAGLAWRGITPNDVRRRSRHMMIGIPHHPQPRCPQRWIVSKLAGGYSNS